MIRQGANRQERVRRTSWNEAERVYRLVVARGTGIVQLYPPLSGGC